jgi:hypothetical protein
MTTADRAESFKLGVQSVQERMYWTEAMNTMHRISGSDIERRLLDTHADNFDDA